MTLHIHIETPESRKAKEKQRLLKLKEEKEIENLTKKYLTRIKELVPKAKVAKKDIVVYRVLEGFKPNRVMVDGTFPGFNLLSKAKDLAIEDYHNSSLDDPLTKGLNLELSGIYSYKNKKDPESLFLEIGKYCIPKGAKYFTGKGWYISNKIKLINPI